MPRSFACPFCREPLDIPAELLGREVKCAACERVFTPPAEEPPTAFRAERDWDAVPTSRRAPRESFPDARRPSDPDDDRWDDRPRRARKGSTTWIWVLLLGVFGLCILPCGGFMVWAVILAFPDFQPYNAPDGKFRAEFPGQPTSYTQKPSDGPDRTFVEFKRNFPRETYFVHYSDLPATALKEGNAAVLEDACRKSLADTPNSTQTSRSSSTYDGYESVDLTIEHPQGATVVRHIVAGKRLYSVGVWCDQWITPEDPRVDHFLNAFKVTAADPVK